VTATALGRQALPSWLPGGRLTGLTWLAWRQSRLLVGLALVVVLLVAGVLGWDAVDLTAAAGPQHLTGLCSDPPSAVAGGPGGPTVISSACRRLLDAQSTDLSFYLSLLQPALVLLPVLLGMMVGAPLLAREYEQRTHQLAWSQSVSPVRWFAARLGMAAAVVGLASLALTGLSDWFWRDYVVLGDVQSYAFTPLTYNAIGVVPIAYALFALALGAAVGLLLRSTLPAVLVTGALQVAFELLMYQLRPYLYPMVSAVQPQTDAVAVDGFAAPANSWLIHSGIVLPDGSRVSSTVDCGSSACRHFTAYYGSYQPASHFWPLQLVESGILLALAAALVLFALRRLRRLA
jgi:hypothetical protein